MLRGLLKGCIAGRSLAMVRSFDVRRAGVRSIGNWMSASFTVRESLPGPRFNERLRVQALSRSRNG